MTNHQRRRRTCSLIVAACVLGARATAWCAPLTFNVNSTADAVDAVPGNGVCATATGACTLRAAIQEANAHVGVDTINIPAGTYVFTITGQEEDAAATGDLDITEAVTIAGAGAASVVIDANSFDRVFDIFANGTTTISGVTIRNGNPGGASGGGILSAGVGGNVVTLNLSNVVLTRNTTTVSGGGIASSDVLSLTDVTVSDNTCAGFGCFGGGLYNGGTATLSRVTVSGNSAGGGGGGIGTELDVNLTNVTLSGNSANVGAAIQHKGGLATLTNVTITGNTAPMGGGAFDNLADVTAKYTIFAHVPAGDACVNFTVDSFTSGGHNIDVQASCGLSVSTDLSNTAPILGPLQNNGGPTQTHALLTGSPAIDAGANDCPPPTTDQRGVARPKDGNLDGTSRCDIGAFELDALAPTTTTTATTTTTTTTTLAPRCGDVNGDGAVNIGDALIVSQYDVGIRTCGQSPFGHPERCDVNGDGGCNIGDALRIAQCDVGLVSCNFTCGTFTCP